jgi:single stranded DNA-binding protein
MASYNKVLLMGNLTRDPEVRYTPKGTAIANLGLAVNRRWTTETGEQKEEVTFLDIEVWGRAGGNRWSVPFEGKADFRRRAPQIGQLGRQRIGTEEIEAESCLRTLSVHRSTRRTTGV